MAATLDAMLEQAVLLDDYAKQLHAVPLDPVPGSEGIPLDETDQLDPTLEEPWFEFDPQPLAGRVGSPIGLGPRARVAARKRIVRAAWLSYNHRGSIHYTQGGGRWQGIGYGRRGKRGQFPNYCDCSSHSTWLLWDATHDRHLRDFVNGASWRAGYTGTQTRHGVRIRRPSLVGDLVFYGGSYWVPGHVATYVGRGRVVSHGSEAGPLIVPWNYRPVQQVRRYIR
jgi:hypothetical protein